MEPKTRNPRQRKGMSDEHKEALAEGREQGRAIRNYLEALKVHAPRRGRKMTPESIQNRIAAINETLPTANALERLLMLQDRQDLEARLAALSGPEDDMGTLEAGFVESAAAYSQRKGISYSAWREAGVSADVLRRSGIGRAG